MKAFIGKWLPIAVIGGTIGWAVLSVALRQHDELPDDAIVLRIGHWQLEAGVRDAFIELAAEYRKLHPNVYVIQDAIPESIYGQWVSTQLMGGTAPDIVECGQHLPKHIWLSYYNRYFVPLSDHANQSNPYNAGTDLATTPLRLTVKDGMRASYVEEMQEYMTFPLAQFGVRVFYNKGLLKQLTGRETPPKEYREFLAVCEQIKSQTNPQGLAYTPVAGSRYHLPMWESMMMDPLTYPAVRIADFNRDGYVGKDELFVAFKTDRVSLDYKPFAARYKMLREITDHFQTGFTGLTRDEAVFLFAQQKAVFMSTGTWDARSLQEQAKGSFEVGVMDFPLPTRDDEYYGDVIEGPLYEKPEASFPFGITRASKHPEVALDFLLFLASREYNERLNEIIGWIPSISGTKMDPMLEAFEPHLRGVYGTLDLNLGGETWIKYWQLYSLYQINQLSFEELVEQFEPFYKEQGEKDYMEQQKDWRRGMHVNEQLIASIRGVGFMSEGEEQQSVMVKYRALTTSRQLWPEIDRSRQLRLLEDGPAQGAVGPYEYSEDVLKRVKDRLKK